MIFIDSNIPMYLVGQDHPNRTRAAELLRLSAGRNERLVTSAEVHQEILHRYRRLDRLDVADAASSVLEELTDDCASIERADVARARRILDEAPGISSRDALHVAVMERVGATRIMTFDAGFDLVPGLDRIA